MPAAGARGHHAEHRQQRDHRHGQDPPPRPHPGRAGDGAGRPGSRSSAGSSRPRFEANKTSRQAEPLHDFLLGVEAMRVTVWGENVHEQRDESVRAIYPDGMHATIAAALRERRVRSPHRHARPARARPDAGRARRHRRAHLVGPHRPRPGRRRRGRARARRGARRHGPARAALRPLLEDLQAPARHRLQPALAQRRRARAGVDGRPEPPDRGRRPAPDHDRRAGDATASRSTSPRRTNWCSSARSRGERCSAAALLHARLRAHLLLQPRRPGLSRCTTIPTSSACCANAVQLGRAADPAPPRAAQAPESPRGWFE